MSLARRKMLPRILRRSALDQFMYAYTCGVRAALPGVTTKKAIHMFCREFGLSESEYNQESAEVIVHRMNKELIEMKRNEGEQDGS